MLDERTKSLDPDLNVSYKLLECEQAQAIKADEEYEKRKQRNGEVRESIN